MNGFDKESDFENAVITLLQQNGWGEVIEYPDEDDLIKNWAEIIYNRNNTIDHLNGCPLDSDEMGQILDQIRIARTPKEINDIINGQYVTIKRTNKNDKLHYGNEVSLEIFNQAEIRQGQTVYQIVRQPRFKRADKVSHDRRGDLMLLINGMPLFHIELKSSNVPVEEACYQIEKYAKENIFTGIFSLIQIFVALNPKEMYYFANPGPDGKFNRDFYFHWYDFNNEPYKDWKDNVAEFLNIPLAHQFIGYYTVPDDSDGVLKVLRSYQYYAVSKICERVSKNDWDEGNQRGGYVWHTTGSGKTMTSFKAAQLIALRELADKVVFLMDRVELGTQSLQEYKNFADCSDDVQDTVTTVSLVDKLGDDQSRLIVSSIQKLSNIKEDEYVKFKKGDLDKIRSKRIVFIIDECHRSTFGEMLHTIKETFPNALFFGFTGTPIVDENKRNMNTTTDIFGDEIHRYSIADGIRDKNVLGFDPEMVMVYKDNDIRTKVALEKAKAATVEEALKDDAKSKVYYHYMSSEVPMASTKENGKTITGIEDLLPRNQYETSEYQEAVVDDILQNWPTKSRNNKFHAIFATSSIPEAVSYYRLFRKKAPHFKVTGLFDPSIDNKGGEKISVKEDGIKEMLIDYKNMFGIDYDMAHYAAFKKDVSARLAHKVAYSHVPVDQQLNLLIVVNQMLTGFDSKWVNTLYLDKVLVYANLIQAFSRTNRLFNINEKPFGTIRYYRMPHTMKQNIEEAVKTYSGNRPRGLFAPHLVENVKHVNEAFLEIKNIFASEKIPNMEKLPDDQASRGKFAKVFKELNNYLQSAKIQGFSFNKKEYNAKPEEISYDENGNVIKTVTSIINEKDYDILLQRYKELRTTPSGETNKVEEITYEIDPYLTELKTGEIDYHYMNSRFEKWLRCLNQDGMSKDELEKTKADLHNSFAFLSQEDQKYAEWFIHDVESGDVTLEEGVTFQQYIARYAARNKNDNVHKLHLYLGVDEEKVYDLLNKKIDEKNINEFGRFDSLVNTVDKKKAKAYFEAIDGKPLKMFRVNGYVQKYLSQFIISGGFEVEDPKTH